MTKHVSLQNYAGTWLPFDFGTIKIIMHLVRRFTFPSPSSVVQLVETLFHMHCTSDVEWPRQKQKVI